MDDEYAKHLRGRVQMLADRMPTTLAERALSYVIEDALDLARAAVLLLDLDRQALMFELENRVQRLEDLRIRTYPTAAK